MRTKLFLYLTLAVLISCSYQNKTLDTNKRKLSNIDIEHAVYKDIENGKFHIDLIIHYPNSIFSFVKQDMMFYSKADFYINILNKKTSELVRNSFKNELFIEKYFDCNNSKKTNNYKLEYFLDDGQYEVTVIIADQISKQKYKATHSLNVESFKSFSLPLLVEKNEDNNFVNVIPESFDGDTLWTKVQILANENKELEDFYITYENKDLVDTLNFSIESLVYDELAKTFFIPLNGIQNNDYQFLVFNFQEQLKKINIEKLGSVGLFWSSNIQELRGVMKYFLSPLEIAKLDSLSDQDVDKYLKSYWFENYEESDELMNELKRRFKYVNDNFSQSIDGWKSSRGKIYLIYGFPTSIESWSENIASNGRYNEVKFEVWHYNEINKKFKFVKRNYFEDFILKSM
jgi:GWxTD domain-containing protein